MRLAVDEQIFAIQAYGGISRYFTELLRQFVRHVPTQVELLPMNAPIVNRYLLDDPELSHAREVSEAHNEWTALARYFALPRKHPACDIVHNTFYLPHGLASTRGAKRIVTVYDMIPELLPQTRRRLDFLTLKRRYVQTADHVICISESTRQDLYRVYGDITPPVTVVHLGVDRRFHPDAARLRQLPDQYVLMVGNRTQYKDGDVLIKAFARIAHDHPDLSLVCVGGGGWSRSEAELLTRLEIADRCSQVDLDDTLMPSAYTHAAAFVFPSRFEGFGLPALEAMACGTPTILTNSTSLPEVGGDAAAYFQPGDVEALGAALTKVLTDHDFSRRLRLSGIQRASEFTWQRTAEQTADVYGQALGAATL